MFRLALALTFALASGAKYSGWRKDPVHCEVCLHVVGNIQRQLGNSGTDMVKNIGALEGALHRHCSKYNKNLLVEERTFCNDFTPEIRKFSADFAQNMSPEKLCKKIDRIVPSACHHKFTSTAGKAAKARAANKNTPQVKSPDSKVEL